MTQYEIDVSETAEAEIDALFQWLNLLSPIAAHRFRDSLSKSIDSLEFSRKDASRRVKMRFTNEK